MNCNDNSEITENLLIRSIFSLLSRGEPMKMIQDWLGHSDMGTTANIYSHIDSESKKVSASVIGDMLE